MINRRSLLIGAGATLIAAPAIVRAASLMQVKNYDRIWEIDNYAMRKWLDWARRSLDMPPGTIVRFYGESPPDGWQLVSSYKSKDIMAGRV